MEIINDNFKARPTRKNYLSAAAQRTSLFAAAPTIISIQKLLSLHETFGTRTVDVLNTNPKAEEAGLQDSGNPPNDTRSSRTKRSIKEFNFVIRKWSPFATMITANPKFSINDTNAHCVKDHVKAK